ncbi:hypothetical protein UlMin_020228 [Ulmus minor]
MQQLSIEGCLWLEHNFPNIICLRLCCCNIFWFRDITGLTNAIRQMMEHQQEIFRQQTERMDQFLNRGAETNPLYERFRKQNPHTFEGSTNPLEAEEWLRSVEAILDFMRLNDQEKISCATFMFKKNARYWWDMVKRTKNLRELTWNEFVVIFNEKYYNATVIAGKTNEFNRIQQGSLSVVEAVAKFEELARFCPILIPDEKEALRGEFYEAKIRQSKGARQQLPPQGARNSFSKETNGGDIHQGNNHFKGTNRTKISHSQQKTNARIFTLTQDEVNAGSSNVVTGQLSIAGSYAYTLIDSGASHSFASSTFVDKLSVPYEKMSNALNIMLPSGDVLLSTYWLKETPIKISDQELYVDLIILEIKDFDVILGMDWLSKYNATIYCKKRKVVFEPHGKEKFELIGDPK